MPSFQKGLDILEYIAGSQDGLRLTDIAQHMDLPASNITLYLNTLIHRNWIIREPHKKKFLINPKAVELFHNAQDNLVHKLLPCADKSMQALHKKYNENILLVMQKGNSFSIVKHIASTHVMRVLIQDEPDYCMHVTAAGRAILAFLPEPTIERYIKTASYVKLTDKTTSDEKTLRETLKKTKEKGYAFNPGEFESEVMATAAPIIINDRPVAALVVQFPTIRHSAEEAESAAVDIMKQARNIEADLIKAL
ncbi:IclR family transcriptional regulator [Tichowtungia aerotolerans]|uniref:Helix-turn-helix domain-containing protein n=1 Tax=Tichowtungia aerotolerans TaxID=2697043 RepID=A0A6P1M4E7_9BACT|nr:IclR family transcriptional regulator [Tichowtungia aerotolerans]QHI68922.1 helix-turn-helix domain-containing protein [Tichowtungia aerotolerans]